MMMFGKTLFLHFTCSLLIFLSIQTIEAQPIEDVQETDVTTTTPDNDESLQSVIDSKSSAFRTVDPDELREAPEIISSRGFLCQTHDIPTSDGYLLTTHRIVNPDYLSSDGHHVNTPKRPIILQHGVLASSITFILNSPGGHLVDDPDERDSNSTIFDGKVVGKNLAFELAKRGYDVWMPNHRGNGYSNADRYQKDDPTKPDWDFCFDDMIDYDNPAIIDYVRNVTGRQTVGYVAHSQGTLAMFGLLATQPKYNSIVKPFIALAPIGSMAHIKSIVRYFAYIPLARHVIARWRGEFLPKNAITRLYSSTVCATPVLRKICTKIMQSIVGWSGEKQINMTRLPVYLTHFPSGTSGKNIVHFRQAVRTGVFSRYDYGKKENIEKYGTPKPPLYPFENITNPDIALFSADMDAFATPKDVEIFRNRLTVKPMVDYRIPIAQFNHLDFLLGKDAGVLVNAPVLQILSQYDNYDSYP